MPPLAIAAVLVGENVILPSDLFEAYKLLSLHGDENLCSCFETRAPPPRIISSPFGSLSFQHRPLIRKLLQFDDNRMTVRHMSLHAHDLLTFMSLSPIICSFSPTCPCWCRVSDLRLKTFEASDHQPNRRTLFHSMILNDDAYSSQLIHHASFGPSPWTDLFFWACTGQVIDGFDKCGRRKSLISVMLNPQNFHRNWRSCTLQGDFGCHSMFLNWVQVSPEFPS